MHPRTALIATLLLTALPAQHSIAWHEDLAAARTLAAQRHAPLFVVFRCER